MIFGIARAALDKVCEVLPHEGCVFESLARIPAGQRDARVHAAHDEVAIARVGPGAHLGSAHARLDRGQVTGHSRPNDFGAFGPCGSVEVVTERAARERPQRLIEPDLVTAVAIGHRVNARGVPDWAVHEPGKRRAAGASQVHDLLDVGREWEVDVEAWQQLPGAGPRGHENLISLTSLAAREGDSRRGRIRINGRHPRRR